MTNCSRRSGRVHGWLAHSPNQGGYCCREYVQTRDGEGAPVPIGCLAAEAAQPAEGSGVCRVNGFQIRHPSLPQDLSLDASANLIAAPTWSLIYGLGAPSPRSFDGNEVSAGIWERSVRNAEWGRTVQQNDFVWTPHGFPAAAPTKPPSRRAWFNRPSDGGRGGIGALNSGIR